MTLVANSPDIAPGPFPIDGSVAQTSPFDEREALYNQLPAEVGPQYGSQTPALYLDMAVARKGVIWNPGTTEALARIIEKAKLDAERRKEAAVTELIVPKMAVAMTAEPLSPDVATSARPTDSRRWIGLFRLYQAL
jgi:hypothetical protein